MSIKDLFYKDNPRKPVSSKTMNELGKEVESADFVEARAEQKKRFLPHVNYSYPANFAKFGSAEEYYIQSIKRIYQTYPYDGSEYEKTAWLNSSSYLDIHMFNKEYPRTTGYALVSPESSSWGAQVEHITTYNGGTTYGVPATASVEYILIKGGPNTDPVNSALKDIFPSALSESALRISSSVGANVFNLSSSRESNLKLDGASGNTVEFWLKKVAWARDDGGPAGNRTKREVIFDCARTGSGEHMSQSAGGAFARLRVELTASSGSAAGGTTGPFLVTYMSGVNGLATIPIGTATALSTVVDGDWHHYAVCVYNTGSTLSTVHTTPLKTDEDAGPQGDGAAIKIELYVDGQLDDSAVTGSTVDYVSGAMVAAIGALVESPSGAVQAKNAKDSGARFRGFGKLSASIDEFRFWKTRRSAEEIGRYYRTQVGGGTNKHDANVQLGVYYKFNEGITQTSSADSMVLDYSGRVTNGAWTGYSSNSRNTGSAIVESSASVKEFKDPIIYSYHPDVMIASDKFKLRGREHDYNNAGMFYKSMPSWIQHEDKDGELLKLTQIMSSYFDTLAMQIKSLKMLKQKDYASGSFKPIPFADRLVETEGISTSEIFADSKLIERYLKRDEAKVFESDIDDIKNRIYQNIYNNLVHIYKSKGTERAFRNFIRCFGVDDELIKLNLYAENAIYKFRDDYRYTVRRKKFIDFNAPDRNDATVFQYSSSLGNSNSVSFISGSRPHFSTITAGTARDKHEYEEVGHALTFETEVIFPRPANRDSDAYYSHGNLTASIFGLHTVSASDAYAQATQNNGTDTTWHPLDVANFQVQAIRDELNSKNVYFALTSSNNGDLNTLGAIPLLTSSLFYNIYDDERWTFAVKIKPRSYPYADTVGGSTDMPEVGTAYHNVETDSKTKFWIIELYGVNTKANLINNSFFVTGTFSQNRGARLMQAPKRLYIGAHRENFTGSAIHSTDLKIGSTRAWFDYLPNEAIDVHAKDPFNFGTLNPHRSAYLFQNSASWAGTFNEHTTPKWGVSSSYVPQMNTLFLNWDLDNITGSSVNGAFEVSDFSSGSLEPGGGDPLSGSRYGVLGPVLLTQHPALGMYFPASSTKVVDKNYLNSAVQQLPEVLNSDDMIQVKTQDDELFVRDSRPVGYFFAIEKSMYATISEEILRYFATIKDFNNLIGDPVNKYRQKYKSMEKLRQLFFERVKNTPDLDKYVEYYRWLDSSINEMVSQLFPASAKHSENLRTVVESHVLERNKYTHKFPSIEERNKGITKWDGTGLIKSDGNADFYSQEGAAISSEPSDPALNTQWWKVVKLSASNGHYKQLSGDEIVDKTITKLRTAIKNSRTGFELGKNYSFNAEVLSGSVTLHGGSNQPGPGLKKSYRGMIQPHSNETLTLTSSVDNNFGLLHEELPLDLDKLPDHYKYAKKPLFSEHIRGKVKLYPRVISSETSSSYGDYLNGIASVYSSSNGIKFTNLHQDLGPMGIEQPLQGPFTSKYVGGYQHRNADLNISGARVSHRAGFDDEYDRPDGFRISAVAAGLEKTTGTAVKIYSPDYQTNGTQNVHFRKSWISRGPKRPINIENIRERTGSIRTDHVNVEYGKPPTIIGNYSNVYEIVQTSGRSENPGTFAESITQSVGNPEHVALRFGGTSTSQEGGGNRDFQLLPNVSKKHIIIERFSAPGGFEVMSEGYLEQVGREKSSYNALPWRNHHVRNTSGSGGGPSASYSTHLGVTTNVHTNHDGLNTLLSRRQGQFGIDSVNGFVRGFSRDNNDSSDYETTPSYHKVHRNTLDRVEFDESVVNVGYHVPPVLAIFVTASTFDNYWVQRPIPRSELKYSWITASIVTGHDPKGNVIGYTSNMEGYDGVVSKSQDDGFASPITFTSGNNVDYSVNYNAGTSVVVALDHVGINYLVQDPIVTSSNIVSASMDVLTQIKYIVGETNFGSAPTGTLLHTLNIHRNGPYQYPTWKQIRTGEHPVARFKRKNNKLDVMTFKKLDINNIGQTEHYNSESFKPAFTRDFAEYKTSPATPRYKPIVQEVVDSEGGITRLRYTHGNNLEYMSRDDLDEALATGRVEELNLYSNIKNAVFVDKTLGFRKLVYTETVFPREENVYLAEVRGRTNWEQSLEEMSVQNLGQQRQFWKDAISGTTGGSVHSSSFTNGMISQGRIRKHGIAKNSMGVLQAHNTGTGSVSVGLSNHIYYYSDWNRPPDLSIWPMEGLYAYKGNDDAVYPEGASAGESGGGPFALSNGELMTHSERAVLWATPEGWVDFSSPPKHHTRSAPPTASQQYLFPSAYLYPFSGSYAPYPSTIYVSDPIMAEGIFKGRFYRTNVIAGKNPWYGSYKDYAEDVKTLGQDYQIVPEFRVSEHMDYYLEDQFKFNNKFLTLDGAYNSSSVGTASNATETSNRDNEFYEVYSHTDFMKHYGEIATDYGSPKRFALTCRGVKKLLPYNGFYPINRCLQLGSLFSQSFASHISGNNFGNKTLWGDNVNKQGWVQSMLQAFYAPGIMYNTIKAGIAVDYPTITGSLPLTGTSDYTDLPGVSTARFFSASEGSFKPIFNYRFPFESLVEPQTYIPVSSSSGKNKIQLLFPHTGGTVDIYYDWNGEYDSRYGLAINNFLGEVPRFFLKDEAFKSVSSVPENKFKSMKSGSTYYMDVEILKSKADGDFIMAQGPTKISLALGTGSLAQRNHTTGTLDYKGAIYGPPVSWIGDAQLRMPMSLNGTPVEDAPGGDLPLAQPGIGNDAKYSTNINFGDPAYAPFTPPYFYGCSIARLTFTPHTHAELLEGESRQFSLNEILAGARIETSFTSSNAMIGLARDLNHAAGLSAMVVSASVNLYGKTRLKEIEFKLGGDVSRDAYEAAIAKDSSDSSLDVWVIGSKFETPILDFSGNIDPTDTELSSTLGRHFPTSSYRYHEQIIEGLGNQVGDSPDGLESQWSDRRAQQFRSGSLQSMGMWGGYGEVPTKDSGIWLQVKDSFPEKTLSDLMGTTGSLLDICGFTPEKKRMGELAEEKIISEAVVAIPFVIERNKEKFFPVLRSQVNATLGIATNKQLTDLNEKGMMPGASIRDMIAKMQKYVVPPHFNFLANKKIKPFVMYIFEFEHKLDKEDLSDIWQGLMPKIAMTAEKDTVTVAHDIATNEFFQGKPVPPNTRWMVFKIKRRAEKSYFATTADSTDDNRFMFTFQVGGKEVRGIPEYTYNWPYDFFSLVELAKLDVGCEFNTIEKREIPPLNDRLEDDNDREREPEPPPKPKDDRETFIEQKSQTQEREEEDPVVGQLTSLDGGDVPDVGGN